MHKQTIVASDDMKKMADTMDFMQSAVNVRAITASFLEILDKLRTNKVVGDDLNNHPFVRTFASKLKALCRLHATNKETGCDMESEAFIAVNELTKGNDASYSVFPL